MSGVVLRPAIIAAVSAVLTPVVRAEVPVDVDYAGVIRRVFDGPRAARGEVSVAGFADDWRTTVGQRSLAGVRVHRTAEAVTTTGVYTVNGADVDFRQVVTADGDAVRVTYRLDARAAADVIGFFVQPNVALAAFAGGEVRIDAGGGRTPHVTVLPAGFRGKDLGGTTAARSATFAGPAGARLGLTFDAPTDVDVQDCRAFGHDQYGLFIPLHRGPLAAGQVVERTVLVRATVPADHRPATVTIDAARPSTPFHGFGGSFCFDFDSAHTDVTLRTLRMTWARSEMRLADWEPANDDADPRRPDATVARAARDTDGSALRRRFELDKRLHELSGGRLILSVWWLPEWAYAEPVTGHRSVYGVVPADRWDEVDESIVTYLQHLKSRYEVEAALFSFNEADYGVYVKLGPDEYRQHVHRLGRRMAAAGLRTKVLLADATSAALGAAMIEPVLADPEAMGHIGGAVGYHPWAGDFRWPYWRDVAARHGLALLVTEIGADPFAWKTGALGTAHYALDDVRRHLEVLNVSGAQSLLTWEWTGNYGVLDTAVDGALAPTMRYWMLWQLTRLSPTPGRVLVTATDRPDDVVAATLLGDGPAPAVAVHVGNLADGRPITVTGLPPHVTAVYVATSTPAGGLTRGAAAVVVSDGRVTVDVPAWSMVTLTTAPIPDPPTEW